MCSAVHLRSHRRTLDVPVIVATDVLLAHRTLGPLHRSAALGHAVDVAIGALKPVALRPPVLVEVHRHGRVNHLPFGVRHHHQTLNDRPYPIGEPLHFAVRVPAIRSGGRQQGLHARNQIDDGLRGCGRRGRCGGLVDDGQSEIGIGLHLGQSYKTGAARYFQVDVGRLLLGQTSRVNHCFGH